MKNRIIALLLCLVMAVSILASCGTKPEETTSPDATSTPENTTSPTTPVENYDGKLVFDHAMALQYAKCFSVDYYKGGYKLIKTANGTEMLIVPEGMSVPAEIGESVFVLRQPVTNILVSSTPTTSLINAIGALDAISLTTYDVDSWYIDSVKDALKAGKMTYIGKYQSPDYEKIAASGCDFAVFSAMLTEDVAEQLKRLGVRVLLDMAAEEEHPLARVEWMKLYGAMFNLEEEANRLVQEQVDYVNKIAELEASGKSVAIFYITSKGALYARNADDYMAKMVDLAGGSYALSDVGVGKSGTINMEKEAFYDKAKDADYIIYVWSLGGKPQTMADLIARADILADFKAVKEGRVWCTTADFFQISNTLGSMINDVHLMLEADENVDTLTYLFKLK